MSERPRKQSNAKFNLARKSCRKEDQCEDQTWGYAPTPLQGESITIQTPTRNVRKMVMWSSPASTGDPPTWQRRWLQKWRRNRDGAVCQGGDWDRSHAPPPNEAEHSVLFLWLHPFSLSLSLSPSPLSLCSYIFLLFSFYKRVENIYKLGMKTTLYLLLSTMMVPKSLSFFMPKRKLAESDCLDRSLSLRFDWSIFL